ncbi:MAG: AmmeMemoRadiSam system protein B [candidate division WS1 bacterium]|nr:AmmeMemoRadiSam system protein B [candidate division WS1 bacterium]
MREKITGPIRQPVVAGQFYAGTETELLQEIEAAYLSDRGPGRLPKVDPDGPRQILGLICPHAGYVYSGAVAATAYLALAADGVPEVVVIIGPSHRLGGFWAGIQSAGAWHTPLGEAQIDAEVARDLLALLPELVDDVRVFSYEHSLEVQVPLLQHLYGERLRIVPLLMVESGAPDARRLGEALAQVLTERNAVIVASTDMTHQRPAETARGQDLALAEYIRNLDAEGLLQERARRNISMCGYGPTAAMLIAAQQLGATGAEILAYHHSGEVAPMPEVVGYLAAEVVRS